MFRFDSLKQRFGALVVALAERYYALMERYNEDNALIRKQFADLKGQWVASPREVDYGPFIKGNGEPWRDGDNEIIMVQGVYRKRAITRIMQIVAGAGDRQPAIFSKFSLDSWPAIIKRAWPQWIENITCELIAKDGDYTWIREVGLVLKADSEAAIIDLTSMHLAIKTFDEDEMVDKDDQDTDATLQTLCGVRLDSEDPRAWGDNPQVFLGDKERNDPNHPDHFNAKHQNLINSEHWHFGKWDKSDTEWTECLDHNGMGHLRHDEDQEFLDDRNELRSKRNVHQAFVGKVAWFGPALWQGDSIMEHVTADNVDKITELNDSGLTQSVHMDMIPHPKDKKEGAALFYPLVHSSVPEPERFKVEVEKCVHDPYLWVSNMCILDRDKTEFKAQINPATWKKAGVVAVSRQRNKPREGRIDRYRWVLIKTKGRYSFLWMMTFAQDWVDLGLIMGPVRPTDFIGIEVREDDTYSKGLKSAVIRALCPCLPYGYNYNEDRFDVTKHWQPKNNRLEQRVSTPDSVEVVEV